jgi:ankyrin repeat protein
MIALVFALVASDVRMDDRDCSESAMLAYIRGQAREDLSFCITSRRAGNLSAGGNRLLQWTLHANMVEETTLLLEGGADPNVQEEETGEVPLDWVLGHREDEVEFVRLLLRYGADPNIRDSDGCTPFHWAARLGTIESLQMLIKAGANVTAVDNEGRDAIGFAWRRHRGDHLAVVAFLEPKLAAASGK